MSQDAPEPSRNEILPIPLVRSNPDATWERTRSGTPIPDGYPEMIDELRILLDRVGAANPPAPLVTDIIKTTRELNARLLAFEAPEAEQISGQLIDVPGRAQLLTPQYSVDQLDEHSMTGRVRFGRHHLGSNNAVHGGAIPQLFDDLLGRLALVGGRTRSRTAYLHVEYRSVTPINRELSVRAWFDREDGRKRFLRGELLDGDRLCAEAEGLFIALRPWQP